MKAGYITAILAKLTEAFPPKEKSRHTFSLAPDGRLQLTLVTAERVMPLGMTEDHDLADLDKLVADVRGMFNSMSEVETELRALLKKILDMLAAGPLTRAELEAKLDVKPGTSEQRQLMLVVSEVMRLKGFSMDGEKMSYAPQADSEPAH